MSHSSTAILQGVLATSAESMIRVIADAPQRDLARVRGTGLKKPGKSRENGYCRPISGRSLLVLALNGVIPAGAKERPDDAEVIKVCGMTFGPGGMARRADSRLCVRACA